MWQELEQLPAAQLGTDPEEAGAGRGGVGGGWEELSLAWRPDGGPSQAEIVCWEEEREEKEEGTLAVAGGSALSCARSSSQRHLRWQESAPTLSPRAPAWP